MLKRLKPYLRWLIVGATLFFIAKTLKDHWQAVLTLRLSSTGVGLLMAALLVTLIAHIWSGWVWALLLRGVQRSDAAVLPTSAGSLSRPEQADMGRGRPTGIPAQIPAQIPARWAIATYLRTNLAKYLPGNIWHFYSRLQACRAEEIPLAPALLSIVLEPLLMAAAALIVASGSYPGWPTLALLPILLGVHPRFLNPVVQRLARSKLSTLGKRTGTAVGIEPVAETSVELQRYPWVPLGGEVLFVLLRGVGFLLALAALNPASSLLHPQQLSIILGAFSLSWVLGLVVPGAPGGVGVFETIAIALLQSHLAPEIVLGAVAGYRLVSTLAELIGAGLSRAIHN